MDPMVTCPYNKAHTVPRSRIQGHLIKCEKRYPKLEICPFNATHRFSNTDIKEHVTNCPDRAEMFPEQEMNEKPKSGYIHTPKPIMLCHYIPETDPDHEIWDD